MNKDDYNTIHMENEFETVDRETPPPPITAYPNDSGRYYIETIKPKKEKGGFKKFVAVAVICAIIGAPLLGLGMGAGQTIAENYLNINRQEDEQKQDQLTISDGSDNYTVSNVAKSEASDMYPNSIVDVVKSAHASVVNITTSIITQDQYFNFYFSGKRQSQGSGTGIIFRQDDENVYIMTNYHVIENASRAYISFDNNEQIKASPVGGNKEEDIAVISVKKSDLLEEGITDVSIAKLGDSSSLEVGEWVVAIGNAIGNGKTVTYGIISALNKEVSFSDGRNPVNLIQTDAAINQGNSGGALVNMKGEVIGMNTAKLAGYTIEGMGFALPINSIIEIIEPIMGNRITSRPFIGISGSTITTDIAEMNGLIVSEGVMLENIIDGGGASDAGLRPGDILLEFDGQKLKTVEDLQQAVASKEIGSRVTAKIVRDNARELEVLITISDMADVSPW